MKFLKILGLRIKTRIVEGLRQVRIIPKGVGYVAEIVYRKKVEVEAKDKSRVVGIDFGSKNIITMVNNIGLKPIVIKDDGRGIKSINQYYNKEKAEIQSIYDLQKVKDGERMRRLRSKRDKKANDYLHKLSRWIVDWYVNHEIGQIIVGRNHNWKQKINIGKRNNQNFVLIPFTKLINQVAYKAEEKGITLKEQEESHTSKCSFLDNESIEHHDSYAGKRITRSIFRTARGILIHADVNARYNIMRKAIPDAVDGGGGCALHPLRYNV